MSADETATDQVSSEKTEDTATDVATDKVDVAALKIENERLKTTANSLLEEIQNLKNPKEKTAEQQTAEPPIDTENQALKDEIAKLRTKEKERKQAFFDLMKKNAVDAKVNELLPRITDRPKLLRRELEDRVGFEMGADEQISLYVLSPEGKRTVDSWDKLVDEFKANPDYDRAIIQTNATSSVVKTPQSEVSKKGDEKPQFNLVSGIMGEEERSKYVDQLIKDNRLSMVC